MKRFSLVVLMILAAMLVFGCGQDEKKEEAKKETKQEAPAVAAQKVLHLAMDADPVSLDPHVQLSGGMLQYSHMVFDPLVRWTQDMQFEGRLAEKWERIDPMTVRFHLRKGVKFHSGNAFTAKDVVFTLDRLKISPDFKGLFEVFEPAVAVDDYTVDLKTKVAYPLLMNMATYIFPMDSVFYAGDKAAIVKSGPSFANDHESGTGPFVVTEREQGVKLLLTKFDGYWGTRGNVDVIEFKPITNEATRVASILSGDVDWIQPVPPQDYDRLDEAKNVDLITLSGTRVITLQLNQKRRAEFADKRVREAIIYATHNEGIVEKILKGRSTTAGQQSPKGYLGYVADLKPRFDLEKAKQLMKEAGYEKGFSVTMIAPNNRYVKDEAIAQAFVGMMDKIGIKVELKTMPKAQYWDEFDAQVADIQMIGWHADTEDSANFTEYLTMCPNKETGMGQYNSGNYCNPEVDKLIADSNAETDVAKRTAMLQKVETILYNDAAFVPLHWQDLSWAASKKVKNAQAIVNGMDFPYFGDLILE